MTETPALKPRSAEEEIEFIAQAICKNRTAPGEDWRTWWCLAEHREPMLKDAEAAWRAARAIPILAPRLSDFVSVGSAPKPDEGGTWTGQCAHCAARFQTRWELENHELEHLA